MNLEIEILVEKCWRQVDNDFEKRIEEIAQYVIKSEGITFEGNSAVLSVFLCDKEKIRELNNDFLGKDKETNVLSFPSMTVNPDKSLFLGDIAICYDVVKKEAELAKKDFLNHFSHLLVHGVLHILGFDHEEERQATMMENKEILYLRHMGIGNPYI